MRTARAPLLPEGGPDDCPVCGANHLSLDEFWSCPAHGHLLQFHAPTPGGQELHVCPAHRCAYQRLAPPKPRSPSKGDPMTTLETRPSAAVDEMYARAAHLERLLPAGGDFGSFAGSAQAALYNNADLMAAAEKDPASFMIALTECAALGHLPGTKEYYLTPRKNKSTVLGIEGYRGIVQRMYNAGDKDSIVVREVCENDYFDFTGGRDAFPVHGFGAHPGTGEKTGAAFFAAQGNRGQMVGVYAYAKFTSGGYSRVSFLSREDVHKLRSDGGWKVSDPYSPWNRMDGGDDHPEFQGRSMWWKSALKRLEPWVTTSAEDKRAHALRTTAAAPAQEHWSAQVVRPAAAPAPAVSGPRNGTRKPLPSGDGGGVTVHEAIAGEFDRLGLDDAEERGVYAARLAGADPGAKLSTGQLAGVMKKLRACADIGQLQALTQTAVAS